MSEGLAENLLLLFDRPNEPICMPKGDKKIVFEVPPEYLTERYQNIAQSIINRYCEESNSMISIKQIEIPGLSVPLQLKRRENFSLFLKKHQKCANALISKFMDASTLDDLLSLAAYCRDRLNQQLFIYALSVAILHRPDTKHLGVPRLHEVFPSLFVENGTFLQAREEATVTPVGSRIPIEIPLEFTGSKNNPEQRVAFWREDIGINLFHWHWHLVYPRSGPLTVVKKDRRGELFYYMHHQIIARYNTERIASKLGPVKPLDDLRASIPEAYFPKLDVNVAGRSWPSRPENLKLSDINRPDVDAVFTLSTLETWRSRINEAIRARSMKNTQGQKVRLDERTGIDIIVNAVESNALSVNEDYYGDLHGAGHVAISFVHDPKGLYLEPSAVVLSTAVAMRDPSFYRWHAYLDNLFHSFIDTLPPYTHQELNFQGINIISIRVNTPGANPNTLNTHWNKSDINLTNGLDFVPRGAIPVRIQHLNHDEYTYNIMVNNTTGRVVNGTVRIFVAPRYYENGRAIPYSQQRKLMIELDKFITELQPGSNGILRQSIDSNVTIPFEATFRSSNQTNSVSADLLWCGCGWPQHMLIPRGTKEGFPMDLFVMITDYNLDKIDQPDPTGCTVGVSYCGLKDLKYPDKRAMGFPFDRRAQPNVRTLSDFLTSNMKHQPITIRFSDTIKARRPGSSKMPNNKLNEVTPDFEF